MSSMMIDLNCDMGEGLHYSEADQEMMAMISSVNLACGFHAGDPRTMRQTIEAALTAGVAVGAHPGLPDRERFGRVRIAASAVDVYDWTLYQLGALQAFLHAAGGTLEHVKPHGALYHMVHQDPKLAASFAKAVYTCEANARVVGLPHSILLKACEQLGLSTTAEGFADRTYQIDGSLTTRDQPGALIEDIEQAVQQVLGMVRDGIVPSQQGLQVQLQIETICLHGDHPQAISFASRIRHELQRHNIAVHAPN